ncbi:MAG: sugar phosphate isomerase/epimerase family protein [Edaphobacter sp.]
MKIGVSAFAWTSEFTEPHCSVLPKLRENGIRGLEIPMFEPRKISALPLRRALEESDLECTICAILPAGINPISTDASVRALSFTHLVECVEKAAELDAKLLGGPLFAPIGYLPGHRPKQEEWNWAVEAFQKLGDTLQANDMMLSIEPVNRSETFFLRTAMEAKTFCDAINDPRIGVTVDTFHANIEEKNIAEAILSLGCRLKHVHASENDRGLLGSGHIDFPAIIQALKKMEYDGYLMIEGFGYSADAPNAPGWLLADPKVSPEEIAVAGTEYLTKLLA